MPENAALHIQARDSDPVRVIDLHEASARIGRAAYCDIRLPDPEIGEEECRLRRRGDSWHLLPSERTTGCVWLDGRPIEGPSPLDFGMSFRVGSHRLTLVASDAEPVWSRAPAPPSAPVVRHDLSGLAASAAPELPSKPLAARPRPAGRLSDEWQSRPDGHDRWVHTLEQTRKWETRFRAVGAKLRSEGVGPAVTADAALPPITAPRYSSVTPPATPILDRVRAARSRPMKPRQVAVQPSTTSARLDPAGVLSPAAPAPAPVVPDIEVCAPDPIAPQSLTRNSLPPEPVARTPADSAAACLDVSGRELAPTRTLITAFDDDDFEIEIETPPAARPRILGATRRVSRERPVEAVGPDTEPSAPEPVACPLVPAPAVSAQLTAPEDVVSASRPGLLRRWLFARAPQAKESEAAAEETVEAGAPDTVPTEQAGELPERVEPGPLAGVGEPPPLAWGLHEPMVTDTYLGEAPDWSARAPFVAATDPVRAPEFAPTVGRGRVLESGEGQALPHAADDPAVVWPPEAAPVGEPRVSAREWPTVSDILAAQGGRGRVAARTSPVSRPVRMAARPLPTVAAEPGQWSLPLWLGWLPAAGLAAAVGVGGCFAGWVWARDSYNAGVVASLLGSSGIRPQPLPKGVAPGRPVWWATTANHLVEWAAFLDRTAAGPGPLQESRALLDHAVEASPLHASVRYALGHTLPGETGPPPLVRTLGETRDIATLAWEGRRLLAEGKKPAALRAFGAALDMAAHADLDRGGSPLFLDDSQARRYTLPTEALIGPVVRDMAEAAGWSYKDWAGIVPPRTAAPVVVARVLRERHSPDADAALDTALAGADQPPGGEGPQAALVIAAQAEALALKGHWAEAEERYRSAIEMMPLDVVRRSWWMNVADVAARLHEETNRRTALDLAKSGDTHDEITQRAVKEQKDSGLVARRDTAVSPARATAPSP